MVGKWAKHYVIRATLLVTLKPAVIVFHGLFISLGSKKFGGSYSSGSELPV
jgi:hypothetical protein